MLYLIEYVLHELLFNLFRGTILAILLALWFTSELFAFQSSCFEHT